jgi:hypothetical protein
LVGDVGVSSQLQLHTTTRSMQAKNSNPPILPLPPPLPPSPPLPPTPPLPLTVSDLPLPPVLPLPQTFQCILATQSNMRSTIRSTNLVTGLFNNHPRIPDTQFSPSSKLSRAIFDKPLSKQSSTVSDVPKLNVPVPADSGLPREKGVGFQLPDTATCVIPPQTFDDQVLVAPTTISSVDVFMTDATITNPSPLASVQESFLLDKSPPVEKSNAQLLDEMMSSDGRDCSPSPDLFIEDDVPLISSIKPVTISKATSLFL